VDLHQVLKCLDDLSYLLSVPDQYLLCLFSDLVLRRVFHLTVYYPYLCTDFHKLSTYYHSLLLELVLLVKKLGQFVKIFVVMDFLKGL